MEVKNKVCLSEPTVFEINGRDIKVYPISLEKVISVNEKLQALEKTADLKVQVKVMAEAVFEIVKDYNLITLDEVKKIPFSAALTVIQTAFGQVNASLGKAAPLGKDAPLVA